VFVDYRKLLKAAIRGMICDYDVPSFPIAGEDLNGNDIPCSREEIAAFCELVEEVYRELGLHPDIKDHLVGRKTYERALREFRREAAEHMAE